MDARFARLVLAATVLWTAWAAVCAGTTAWAQQAQVRIEVSARKLTVDEELQVRVQATGQFDEMLDPACDGFDLQQGGRQQQVSIINGRMSTIENQMYVARPQRPGKLRIGPAVLRLQGRDVAKSEAVEIEVVSLGGEDEAAEPPEQATNAQRFAGQAFFVRPSVSVLTPFAGQPFVVTWELYWSRETPTQGIRGTQAPKFANLDVENLLDGKQPDREAVQFSGRPYLRQITHQAMVMAAVAGKVRIDGPRYRIEAGDFFETRALRVSGPALDMTIRPIPTAGRPASFAAANVGKLELTGRVMTPGRGDTLQVATGARLLIEYQVSGDGNLLGLRDLRPPAVAGMSMEALPGRGDDQVQRTLAGTEGKRVWQTIVSFDKPGTYVVPALEFTAFDPYDEKFATSRAGPFEVLVTGAAVPNAETPAATASAAGLQPGDSPAQPITAVVDASALLRPIAAEAHIAQTAVSDWTATPAFWGLACAPWAAAVLVWLTSVWRRRRLQKSPQRTRAHALRDAQHQLQLAAGLGPDQGYAAVRDAVARYLAIVTGTPLSGLTEHALGAELRAAGADREAADQLTVELQHCDFARFAPGGDRDMDLAQTARRVAEVLAKLDVILAPTKSSSGRAAATVLVVCAVAAVTGWLPGQADAATLDDSFATANQDYVQGKYGRAQQGYRSLLTHGLPSPAIHYNLANTLVKMHRLGEAVGHYKQALRLNPPAELRSDVTSNLSAVRSQLADQARRRHATLHIFDESPELDVAIARAAPRGLLAILGALGGFAALTLLVWGLRAGSRSGRRTTLLGSAAGLAVVQVLALLWLFHAQRIEALVVHAVVVEEDASMAPCSGVGEAMGLPEGLEVRRIAELPNGRVEVRLPNGRQGCVAPEALYFESSL
jgi:hypothetical protein